MWPTKKKGLTIGKKKKSLTQQTLHQVRRVSTGANGVVRIVRDSYSNHKQGWWEINKQVLERDDHRCRATLVNADGTKHRCTRSKAGGYRLEVHHVKELSKGGKTIMANLITLCEACHCRRHKHMQGKH